MAKQFDSVSGVSSAADSVKNALEVTSARASLAAAETATRLTESATTVQGALRVESARASLAAAEAATGIPQIPGNVNANIGTRPTAPQRAQSPLGDASPPKDRYLVASEKNILEAYASVNYLFTMACVSPKEFNSASYRTEGFDSVIFSSAGRYDAERPQTALGRPEYFIESLKQVNVIAPNPSIGNTYAVKYEFEIFEPYSMGGLLQSVSKAAFDKGYKNHLEAPFVIRLDFQGWDQEGNAIPGLVEPKFFTMRLTKMSFSVDAAGSKYDCEAVPYNQISYSDTISFAKRDVSFVINDGDKTVERALKSGPRSLEKALNKIEQDLAKDGRSNDPIIEYVIEFPEHGGGKTSNTPTPAAGATVEVQNDIASLQRAANVLSGENARTTATPTGQVAGAASGINKIGKAKYNYDLSNGGKIKFEHAENVVEDGNPKNVELPPDDESRVVQYSRKTSIITMITDAINASDHVKNEITKDKDNKKGFTTYFKVDVQTELKDLDPVTGLIKKIVRFRVLLYDTHTNFKNPTSVPVGYDFIKTLIKKEYQYMYTGHNTDVLDFDINVDYMFYQGIMPNAENVAPTNEKGQTSGTAESTVNKATLDPGVAGEKAIQSVTPAAPIDADPTQANEKTGGIGFTTPENQIAQNFHRTFVEATSADMVKLNMKILGDPFWLSDSGLANYTAARPGPEQVNSVGAMNYEAGDIYVYVVFRAPQDVDTNAGMYKFPEDSAFGGIYRVVKVENDFEGGMFTQTLDAVRMVGQTIEYDGNVQPGNTAVVGIGDEVAPSTSPLESNSNPLGLTPGQGL